MGERNQNSFLGTIRGKNYGNKWMPPEEPKQQLRAENKEILDMI